jgi:hypothetical protein
MISVIFITTQEEMKKIYEYQKHLMDCINFGFIAEVSNSTKFI